MSNWANTPGPKPGNSSATNLHKSIAAGATMPSSKRVVTGCAKVPGLSKG